MTISGGKRGILACCVAVLLWGFAALAPAASVYYDPAGSGTYMDTGTRWVGGTAPADGDAVYLTADSASDFLVYYRYGGTGSPVASVPVFTPLTIDNTGGGTMTLRTSGTYPDADLESSVIYVGEWGRGAVDQLSGSVSTTRLYLGQETGSSGTYTLSGNGTLAVSNDELIGDNGAGAFTQTGGTHTVAGTLYLGFDLGGSGTYTLSGGSLQAADDGFGLALARYGTGDFDQSGGQVDLGTGTLTIGMGTYTGSYTLSGDGTLQAAAEYVGRFSQGTLTQTGGSNTTNDLYVGGDPDSGVGDGTGTYVLSGDGTLQSDNAYIGSGGQGLFHQANGSASIGSLLIGNETSGRYRLWGGTLSVGYLNVGRDGEGIFTQTGGTLSVEESLYLGFDLGGSGTYTLSGGSLQAADDGFGLVLARYGTGDFDQSGGQVDLGTGTLTIGMGNFAGSYTLSNDGTLQAQTEYVGRNSRGFFTQTGGSNTTVDLYLGSDPDSGTGSYSLSGGTLQTENAYIGSGGQGMLHQSGGSHTVTDLYVGYETNGIASLSAGTLSVGRYMDVGREGEGTFTQTGGTLTVDQSLHLGYGHGSSGTYTLSGGSLQAAGRRLRPGPRPVRHRGFRPARRSG
jgi:hypothetical protein